MALVATYGKRYRNADGTITLKGTLAFDSSYPTHGEAITGWDSAKVINIMIDRSGIYDFGYDHVNKLVFAWTTAGGGAEVANATDLSSLTAVKFELKLRE